MSIDKVYVPENYNLLQSLHGLSKQRWFVETQTMRIGRDKKLNTGLCPHRPN